MHRALKQPDQLFDMWPVIICTQVIQCLSIMSACILHLRPFLEALTSGFINGDDLRRRGAIQPYALASSNLAFTFALKDQKTSIDPARPSESDGPTVAAELASERDLHPLPEIARNSPLPDIGHMRLSVAAKMA